MMAELKSDLERFQEMIGSLFRDQKAAETLQRMRAKFWERFCTLGLPTRKTEVYQYVRLRQLFSKDFALSAPSSATAEKIRPYILPECEKSVLTFVNGFFRPDLSQLGNLPKKVLVMTLEEAMRTFGPLLNNQIAERLQAETDPFAALNGALSDGACFIYFSPQTFLDFPVQILQVVDNADLAMLISPRVELFLGARSEASLISTAACLSGENHFVNSTLNLSLEEEAKATLVQSVLDLPADSWHFEAVRVQQKGQSSLKTVSVTNGSQGVRFDYRVQLSGENAESFLNGLWALSGKREAHVHVLMDHRAPQCQSLQFFKGVLADLSRSSFEGKIYVHREAQKTQAFQLNNNLLLSDRASADSKPNLEIFADDVKASHGATVGQLDSEQLFYLKARGIPEEEAKKLLVFGYCKEMIEKIPVQSLRDKIISRLKNGLL